VSSTRLAKPLRRVNFVTPPVEMSLSKELNERLESYAEEREQSVQTVAREAIEQHLDACDTREVLAKACSDGTLREESRTCQHIEHADN
jgi:predicted transcriptional regulator